MSTTTTTTSSSDSTTSPNGAILFQPIQNQSQTQIESGPRRGIIFPTQKRQLLTPNFIIGTAKGSTPHLTPDMVDTLPEYKAMQVSLGEVYNLHPALQSYQTATNSSQPYHTMLCLPQGQCVVMGLRNPTTDLMYFKGRFPATPEQIQAEDQFPYQLSSKIAATRSEIGAIRITPKEFITKSSLFKPDILLLGGQDSDITETKSRAEKTMRRNLEWVDELYKHITELSSTNPNERIYRTYTDIQTPTTSTIPSTRPLLIAPIEGGIHLDKRTRNGGVISRKGTNLWVHNEQPIKENFDNEDKYKEAMKTYEDKIVNEGFATTIVPDGYHFGGIGTTENSQQRIDLIKASLTHINYNDSQALIPSRLRMTTVTGEPNELIDLIMNGIDLISMTYPQTLAEEGVAMKIPIQLDSLRDAVNTINTNQLDENDILHQHNIMNLRDEVYVEDPLPIDPNCTCYACSHHSRSYINHLLNTHEMLAEVLLMLHNMHQYSLFFQNIRDLIEINNVQEQDYQNNNNNTQDKTKTTLQQWADFAKRVYIPHGHILHRNARRRYIHQNKDPKQQQSQEEVE